MDKPTGYKEALALKKDDIQQLEHEGQYEETFNGLIRAIKYAEQHAPGRVESLREKIDWFDQPGLPKPVGGVKDIKRQDWENNNQSIKAAIRNQIIEKRGFPHINTIAEKTKLSRVTVYKHLEAGLAGDFMDEHLKMYEYLTIDLFQLLYMQAIEGSPAAAKVYIDSMLKVQQMRNPPAPTIRQQNNYVQVNNTRIDELTINQLPDTARVQIEQIINQYASR